MMIGRLSSNDNGLTNDWRFGFMYGILIQYTYDGDEEPWLAAVEEFVTAIDADPALRGKFGYRVNVAADGVGRVHVGQWDSEETLAHLQS
jgi:hypothetical protein